MIRKIILENYMSHARTEIELAPGLTVICGPNNCGKSAVVAALETLCFDLDGGWMVRHDEKLCRVTVETDDDHVIVWQRKRRSGNSGTSSYVIDGREVHRVTPADLQEALRLPKVEHQGKKFDVHLSKQKEPIFLIESEADSAAFFSAGSEASRLLEMQRRHKERFRDKRSQEKEVARDVERLSGQLQTLSPLDQLGPMTLAAEQAYEKLVERDKATALLHALTDELARRLEYRRECSMRSQRLAGLKAAPALGDDRALEQTVHRIEVARRVKRRLEAQVKAAERINSPPALPDVESLAKLIDDRQTRARQCILQQAKLAALAKLNESPSPKDTTYLIDIIKRLKNASHLAEQRSKMAEAYGKLTKAAEPADTRPVAELIVRLSQASKKTESARQRVNAAERALAALSEQLDHWVLAHPTCPVCLGPVDRARLLEGVHRHG